MAKGASGSQANTLVSRGGAGGNAATAPPTAAGLRKRSSKLLEPALIGYKLTCARTGSEKIDTHSISARVVSAYKLGAIRS